jgi:hypothetical protein
MQLTNYRESNLHLLTAIGFISLDLTSIFSPRGASQKKNLAMTLLYKPVELFSVFGVSSPVSIIDFQVLDTSCSSLCVCMFLAYI